MAIAQFKVVFLGDSGVGKTSIMQRFVKDTFEQDIPATIGAAFSTKLVEVDCKEVKFNVWDTAGQERYHALAKMYYRDAAAAIFVVDLTREHTVASLNLWHSDIETHGPRNIMLAVAGNKADIGREGDQAERDWSKEHGATYQRTSAKTGAGIVDLFQNIGRALLSTTNSHSRVSHSLFHPKKTHHCCGKQSH